MFDQVALACLLVAVFLCVFVMVRQELQPWIDRGTAHHGRRSMPEDVAMVHNFLRAVKDCGISVAIRRDDR